jgi:hypothetical protein
MESCYNLANLEANCNATKKVGGVTARVWIGAKNLFLNDEVNTNYFNFGSSYTDEKIWSLIINNSVDLVGNELAYFEGVRFKNNGNFEVTPGENVNTFTQNLNLVLFHYSQSQIKKLEQLLITSNLIAFVLTEAGQTLIRSKSAKVFLVSNLLEHIPNAVDGIEKLKTLMEPKTYLILTGPKSFPYHPDPIDNMFRPSISEIRGLFEKEFEIVKLDLIRNGTVFSSSFFGRSAYKTKKVINSKGGFLRLLLNFNFIYKMFRNLFYPASAFCLLAIKK